MHNIPEHATEKTTFIGKVSHPFSSPTITRGYVEFKVQPVQRGPLLPGLPANLISHSGETYHVTIRGIGRVTPNGSIPNAWRPGDFLVAVDGITIDQADEMRLLQQVLKREQTRFLGEIKAAKPSPTKRDRLDLQVLSIQHGILHQGTARVITPSGETYPVVIRNIAVSSIPSLPSEPDRLLITIKASSLPHIEEGSRLIQEGDE